jgi:hypothetical protein
MARFTDADGREWPVRFTIGMMPRLRDAGLDLNAVAADPDKLGALDNPETLLAVLWVCVEKHANGITREQFADALDGPSRFAAADAVLEAFLDFCQRPAVATVMKERLPGAMARAEATMTATPDGSNGSAGNSPEAPASATPGN